MDTAKENISKECRTRDTCFMYVATIGGNFFIRNHTNKNNVNRYNKYLFSVIISLITNVSGVEIIFLMEQKLLT